MNSEKHKIGIPSSHVAEIFPIMDATSKAMGSRLEVLFPNFINFGGTWPPNFDYYRKRKTERKLPKMCYKVDQIMKEVERMINEGITSLLIPMLVTDRFRTCAGANSIINLIKNIHPEVELITPEFFDEYEPTEESIRGMSSKYKANFAPLRELADDLEIPSTEEEKNKEFFQLEDLVKRAQQLIEKGEIQGVVILSDEWCAPRKWLNKKIADIFGYRLLNLIVDEDDFRLLTLEKRLTKNNQERISNFFDSVGIEEVLT